MERKQMERVRSNLYYYLEILDFNLVPLSKPSRLGRVEFVHLVKAFYKIFLVIEGLSKADEVETKLFFALNDGRIAALVASQKEIEVIDNGY